MSYNSDKSQIVKTYGKPRHTQKLGNDSVWHDNLIDDFDRCFGHEDAPSTTFLSPEPVNSVSMYDAAKHKKKVINKIKTIGGRSMQEHNTFNDHKMSSSKKKRNIEYSFEKYFAEKKLLKSIERKKKIDSIGKVYSNFYSSKSNEEPSSNTNNPKATKSSIRRFVLSKEKCSTPLQKFKFGSPINSIPTKRKKKETTNKSNSAGLFSTPYSEPSRKLDYSNLKDSNIKDESIHFDLSTIVPGSCVQLTTNEKNTSNNEHSQNKNVIKDVICPKFVLNKHIKPQQLKKNKNKNSKKLSSSWSSKVMNILSDQPSSSYNEVHNNEAIRKKNINTKLSNQCFESVIDKPIKPLTLSHKLNNNLSGREAICRAVDFNNLNEYCLEIEDKRDKADEANEYKSCNNSLCESYSQIEENTVIEIFHTPNVTNNDETVVDKFKSLGHNLPQLNQFEKPLTCINSTDNIKSSIGFFSSNSSSSLDLKNSNVSWGSSHNITMEHIVKSESNDCTDTSLQSFETINVQSSSNQFVSNVIISEQQSLVDIVTNKLSNIIIDDNISLYDKFIIEESISEKVNQSMTSCKSTSKKDILNDSDSQSLSSLENITIISKQHCIDMYSKERAISSLYTSTNDSFKCNVVNANLNLSNNKVISDVPIQTFCSNINDHNQNPFDTFHSNANVKSDLNVDNSCSIINQEKGRPSYYESSRLLYQPENTFIDFNDISSIYYKEKTTIEDHINRDSTVFNDNLENNKLNSFQNTNFTYFNDISSIYNNQKTTIEDQINSDTTVSNDNLETSKFHSFQNTTRRKRYASRFPNIGLNSVEECVDETNTEIQNLTRRCMDHTVSKLPEQSILGFRLEPGKKWRRSIVIMRNFIEGNLDQTANFSQNTTKGRNWVSTVDEILGRHSISNSIYQRLDISNNLKDSAFNSSRKRLSRNSTENNLARKHILDLSNEKKIVSFESWMMPKIKKQWKKVGEGVYGEVFSYYNTVIKIIPIEGNIHINSERQKRMFEVYSEILVITELNKLFNKFNWNQTNAFCKLKNLSCVKGKYPTNLIQLWDQYNHVKGSDNDNPNILPDDQIFIILEMENGGIDVESFIFNSANQAFFAFLQIVYGLAVAEEQYSFEHRDLHIGNILVKKVSRTKKIIFKLDGDEYDVPSQGVKITIIDYTLSRITHGCKSIYNDLTDEKELFTSDGDYQFEIYRKMREETMDQWSSFKPKTNIYWLHYVLDKMIKMVHYKNTATKIHNNGLLKLKQIENVILTFDSCKSLALSDTINNFF